MYINLNMFCIGIDLKIEYFEGGRLSYILINLVTLGIKVFVEWCSSQCVMCGLPTGCTVLIDNFYSTVFSLGLHVLDDLLVHHREHCLIYCIMQFGTIMQVSLAAMQL
jgi:hypothetical protein